MKHVALACALSLAVAGCQTTEVSPPVPPPVSDLVSFRDGLAAACHFLPTAASVAALFSAYGGNIQLAVRALCAAVDVFKRHRAFHPGQPAVLNVGGARVQGSFI